MVHRRHIARLAFLVALGAPCSAMGQEESDENENPLAPPWEAERVADREVAESLRFSPGSGLVVESRDGDFSMEIGGRLQVLADLEWDDGGAPEPGAEMRRARLWVGGHLFGEDNRYHIELGLSPRDDGMREDPAGEGVVLDPLLDFYVELGRFRDLTLRVGQYVAPFSRQRLVSSADLQMVDRSIVNQEFNLDRDVGFDLRSDDLFGVDALRYHVGLYTGRGRDPFAFEDVGPLAVARVEVLPFGRFDDYEESDFARDRAFRLSLGFAYAYLHRARFDRGTLGDLPEDEGTTDMHLLAADAMLKCAGFSMISELVRREAERRPGPAGPPTAPRSGLGFMVQAGYLIPRHPVEIAGRYALLRGATGASLDDDNELSGGLSVYVAQHLLKVQVDYIRSWETHIDSGGHRIRLQLQASL